MATKAKEEALTALREVQAALAGTEPIVGLRREQLALAAGYAARRVEAIEELRIARRRPKAVATAPPDLAEATS